MKDTSRSGLILRTLGTVMFFGALIQAVPAPAALRLEPKAPPHLTREQVRRGLTSRAEEMQRRRDGYLRQRNVDRQRSGWGNATNIPPLPRDPLTVPPADSLR